MKTKLLFLFFLTASYFAIGQTDTTKKSGADEYEMSIDELMNIEVKSTTQSQALSIRETPGIVSIITKNDIQSSGARDLIDVLRLIPGFDFGYDVKGQVSIGMRGIWANEGKVAIYWDGQNMAELLYGTYALSNHYPVDLIEKIEVIRGPGSAIYGGNAELCVINITTEKDKDGVNVYTNSGSVNGKMFSRNEGGFSYFKKNEKVSVDIQYHGGNAILSNKTGEDFYGTKLNFTKYSDIQSSFTNVGLGYKNLKARFIADKYDVNDRTGFTNYLISAPKQTFLNYLFETQYTLKASEKFNATAKFNFKHSKPFYITDSNYNWYPEYNDLYVNRYTYNLSSVYTPTKNVNVLFGCDYYSEQGKSEGVTYYKNNVLIKSSDVLTNLAFFGQALYQNKIANLTAGARYENHSIAGTSFVPRFAITKVLFEKLHLKALYSNAFKTPTIQNASLNDKIKPEKTQVIEFEAGYKLNNYMFITGNVFQILIKDPIIYRFISTDTTINQTLLAGGSEYYQNYNQTGSRGFEVEYKVMYKKLTSLITYSYYESYKNEVEDYFVMTNKYINLGFPNSKASWNLKLQATKNMSVNSSLIYYSAKYYDKNDFLTADYMTNRAFYQYKVNPSLIWNMFIMHNNLIFDNLNCGIGVNNILDGENYYIQPYSAGLAPMPYLGREVAVKLNYNF